jgi:hypothetical protein
MRGPRHRSWYLGKGWELFRIVIGLSNEGLWFLSIIVTLDAVAVESFLEGLARKELLLPSVGVGVGWFCWPGSIPEAGSQIFTSHSIFLGYS